MDPLDDHFHRPRNAGVLRDADIHVEVENPVCGDVLHLYLNHSGKGASDRVTEASFQVYGCPAAIAAGSLLTELLRGQSHDQLRGFDRQMMSDALGGLSTETVHAAVLAADAVLAASSAWRET